MADKTIFRLVALFCGGLLVFALVLQYFFSVAPCPLCILQRFFYLLIGFVAVSASFGWVKNISVRAYGVLIGALALLGGIITFRQVWLQLHPSLSDVTKCIVPLGSFFDSIIFSLGGVGNCGTRDFVLFGLSLAEWSLFCFSLLFLVGMLSILSPQFKKSSTEKR